MCVSYFLNHSDVMGFVKWLLPSGTGRSIRERYFLNVFARYAAASKAFGAREFVLLYNRGLITSARTSGSVSSQAESFKASAIVQALDPAAPGNQASNANG